MTRALEHRQQIWPKIVNGFLSVYQSANFRCGRGNPWLISNWQNGRFGSCVDGSPLARVNLTFVQIGRVQSCVRPVNAAYVAAGPNAIRGSGPNHKRALVKRPDPNGFSRPSVRPILHYVTFTPPNSSPPMSQLHSWAAPFLVVALTTLWHIAMPVVGAVHRIISGHTATGHPPLSWSTVIVRKTEDQRWRISDTNRKR